ADLGAIGPLASMDLDALAPRAPGGGRQVSASGCRVDLPSAPDGRGGARLIRMAIESAAGPHDVVLEYAGEGRLAIDGGAPQRHGSPTRYGPRISATRVALGAGRHDIELRLGSRSGLASFSLFVL